ncbi:unannotated protein [freshwater metagenome]|uniref:Unannotated protein n=1 Tax=freshwater metagenome TaxID=449393 RepID=A0A6J7HJL4_9ZZZZ
MKSSVLASLRPSSRYPSDTYSSEELAPVSVGERLQQARVAAGFTVEDLADHTKIRASIITAIEHDDFSYCGGVTYARGQIRSLAKALRTDSVPILVEFEIQMGMPPSAH